MRSGASATRATRSPTTGYLHESVAGLSPEAEEQVLLRGLAALDVGRRSPGRPAGVRRCGRRAGPRPRPAQDPRLPLRLEPDGRRPSPTCSRPGRRAASSSCRSIGASTTGSPTSTCRTCRAPARSPARPRSSRAGSLELDALVDDGGLFVLTNHPFVSGRPSRAAALEALDRAGPGDRRAVDRDLRRGRPMGRDPVARAGRRPATGAAGELTRRQAKKTPPDRLERGPIGSDRTGLRPVRSSASVRSSAQ